MSPLNFLGGFCMSPMDGHTTHLSSTDLKKWTKTFETWINTF